MLFLRVFDMPPCCCCCHDTPPLMPLRCLPDAYFALRLLIISLDAAAFFSLAAIRRHPRHSCLRHAAIIVSIIFHAADTDATRRCFACHMPPPLALMPLLPCYRFDVFHAATFFRHTPYATPLLIAASVSMLLIRAIQILATSLFRCRQIAATPTLMPAPLHAYFTSHTLIITPRAICLPTPHAIIVIICQRVLIRAHMSAAPL